MKLLQNWGVLFFLILSVSVFAQEEVVVYTERQGTNVTIFADNPAIIPMTIDLSLELINMETDFGGDKGIFLIPGQSKRHQITKAKAIRQAGRTGLRLDSFIYTGDIDQKPDHDYLYELPFEAGRSYVVSQGYNGRFSHKGQNAIDFGLEVGEKVYAARGGIVYKVVEKNSKSCKHSSCQDFNNHITVYHSDGTFSEYSHLKKNGAVVNVGDRVEAGQHIGFSGNTGWSSGPHLHFVVYKYDKKGQRVTFKTKFKTSSNESIYLTENKEYTRK